MKFLFGLHQNVEIIELQRPGKIISIWVVDKGIKYEVRYFIDGKVNEVYFYEDELTTQSTDKTIGFKNKKEK